MSIAKTPVAVLVRILTVKQETARQVSELKAYAESKSYEVIEVCEETISGTVEELQTRLSILTNHNSPTRSHKAQKRTYAASLIASLWPRMRTVSLSCSTLSGFFKTVIGPLAKMRSSIALSG